MMVARVNLGRLGRLLRASLRRRRAYRFGIRDLMGSSIADKDFVCTTGFVTIEHETPIPDRYPSYF
jgi:hypothetical protein